MFIMPPSFIIPMSITEHSEDRAYILDLISLHVIVTLLAFIVLMAVL